MALAQEDNGRAWRLKTRSVALWFTPVQPSGLRQPPDRTAERQRLCNRPLVPPQNKHTADLEGASHTLSSFTTSQSGFLAWERHLNSAGHPWETLATAAQELFGPAWCDFDPTGLMSSLLETHDEWNNLLLNAVDLQYFLDAVCTAQQMYILSQTSPP